MLQPLRLLLFAFLVLGTGCGREKLSDRERERERLRATAEVKRGELRQVAAFYRGSLQLKQQQQDLSIALTIKDVPDTSAGDIDPVLVPKLTGSMQLTYGDPEDGELYSFAVKSADFDTMRKRIDLVFEHETFKDIVMSLTPYEDGAEGSWQSSFSSSSGNVVLAKANNLRLAFNNPSLSGNYQGLLTWNQRQLFQNAEISLAASHDKPETLKLSSSIKISTFADAQNRSYTLNEIEHNPITGTISFKGADSDIYLTGKIYAGEFNGKWYSKINGLIGDCVLSTVAMPKAPANFIQIAPLGGAYRATFTTTNPNIGLPERALLTVVPFNDPEKPGNIGITGNIRFYAGSYDSIEFWEFPFAHSEYNFFNQDLDVQTSGAYKLTLDVQIGSNGLKGKIYEDAFGEIGTLTTRQEQLE